MNIYAYDCMDYDKGIILADSIEEAKEIFHTEYPEFTVVADRCSVNEAEISLVGTTDNKDLLCTVPW